MTLLTAESRIEPGVWDEWVAKAIGSINSEVGARIYGGVSTVYEDLGETALRCAEALRLLSFHVLDGREVLTPRYGEDVMSERVLPAFDSTEMVQCLVAALFKQDREEVHRLVEDMFRFFRESGYLLPEAWNVYEELFALLRQRLRKSGMTGLDYALRGQPDPNIYNSYAGLETVVLEDMEELKRLIDQNGIDKSYWIVEKAKKYIIGHYRTDLKASEVAAWLKITPSYFSYIFKQSTGKGFTEYMNEMRIDQAKHLLATTQDKVFEIADKVGYREYKYFVSVFKTYTGMTPKEYRGLRVSREMSESGGETSASLESGTEQETGVTPQRESPRRQSRGSRCIIFLKSPLFWASFPPLSRLIRQQAWCLHGPQTVLLPEIHFSAPHILLMLYLQPVPLTKGIMMQKDARNYPSPKKILSASIYSLTSLMAVHTILRKRFLFFNFVDDENAFDVGVVK